MNDSSLASRVFAAFAWFLVVSGGAAAELPSTPPAPSAPRNVTFPAPAERVLPNGLRVIVVERHSLPLVSVEMLVAGGAGLDPNRLPGLANFTSLLLTKGTATSTAPQIAERVEQLGATLESGAEWDDSFSKLTALATQAGNALEILADVVQHPAFKDEEIARLRGQLVDQLHVELGDPANLARFASAKLNFGDRPYGHPVAGLPSSLGRIKREDVLKLYGEQFQPRHGILVICGDLPAARAFDLAKNWFGDWKNAETTSAAAVAECRPPSKSRNVIINMPGAGQAAVMLVKQGISRDAHDYFRGEVANAVLGIGYSSRLNEEIRIKRGLSYGAESALDARRETGPFVVFAQTKNESVWGVLSLMRQEVAGLSKEPVGPDELRTRKAALTGEFARGLETNEGFADETGKLALYGISVDSLSSRLDQLNAVTPEEVQSFAAEHFQAEGMSALLVGDANAFYTTKEQLKDSEVIEISDLDLESDSLRKASHAK